MSRPSSGPPVFFDLDGSTAWVQLKPDGWLAAYYPEPGDGPKWVSRGHPSREAAEEALRSAVKSRVWMH